MQRCAFFLIFNILLLSSCQNDSNLHPGNNNSFGFASKSYESTSEAAEYEEMDDDFEDQISPKKTNIERKIIRNAQVKMQVNDIKKTYPQIEAVVKGLNGYISSTNMQNSTYRISNDIIIRIPNEKLDSLLQLVENQSVFIDNSSITSSDVTEEYIDIETRLKTKKEVRERYLNILREKAKTVKDVLLAEEQIRVLTEEIEAKEGRLRYLKNRIGLSTLTLNIYQKVPYIAKPNVHEKSFLTKIKEGFINGWQICLGIFLGLINIWPLVIIFIVFIWKRKAIWRRIRRKKDKS